MFSGEELIGPEALDRFHYHRGFLPTVCRQAQNRGMYRKREAFLHVHCLSHELVSWRVPPFQGNFVNCCS